MPTFTLNQTIRQLEKRSLIYSIQRVKNIDKQVQMSLDFLEKESQKMKKNLSKK